jgi:hypothetical protein
MREESLLTLSTRQEEKSELPRKISEPVLGLVTSDGDQFLPNSNESGSKHA